MAGWSAQEGLAIALPQENIDTDQLIPARFMSRPRRQGYGAFLLHDVRKDDPDHPLNQTQPTMLVAGRNFGSGSSREAAVYALVDFGIRAVIAPSFGDIFAANAVNNALLPARVDETTHAALLEILETPQQMHIDLALCTLRVGRIVAPFEIDATWRQKLTHGWDDIDLTRQHADEITAFAAQRPDWTTPRT